MFHYLQNEHGTNPKQVYEKHFKNTFTGRVVYTSAAKAI
jgi:hypothetical protein